MSPADYRIESSHPVVNRLLPAMNLQRSYHDPSLAVAVAAKSVTVPMGQEIRVVHVPTGEVVFRTTSGAAQPGAL